MCLKESRGNRPLLVGLTGGIGSGKSTVAKIFKSIGIKVYNSDVEAKKIVNTDIDVICSIKKEFGEDVYFNYRLDSKKLAGKVFNNIDELKKLNDIVHPKVKVHFENWVNENKNDEILIKEAAILIESEAYKGLNYIILVTASEEKKIQRVVSRDNVTVEEIKNRINSQLSDIQKIKYSDFVINNNETTLLTPQILKIYNELKKE